MSQYNDWVIFVSPNVCKAIIKGAFLTLRDIFIPRILYTSRALSNLWNQSNRVIQEHGIDFYTGFNSKQDTQNTQECRDTCPHTQECQDTCPHTQECQDTCPHIQECQDTQDTYQNSYFVAIPGITFQDKLDYLNQCNCCARHKINKPKKFQAWIDTPATNTPFSHKVCNFDCRHLARWICREAY